MIVKEVQEIRHSVVEGWLEFQLLVDWQDSRGEEIIPFTYNPNDKAPLTQALRDHIVPTLAPEQIQPRREETLQ